MRVPATATDRKIAPFEPALEELAISPEPRTSQRKPGDFERMPAAMAKPPHRAGAYELLTVEDASVTRRSNTVGAVPQTLITGSAGQRSGVTIAAWRNAGRGFQHVRFLIGALALSMLIAIGLFSLGWLLGALAIWLWRPGEAAQRASPRSMTEPVALLRRTTRPVKGLAA
ncbi:MAG: hypothetical protein DMG58_16605 [Acidobacteria bacterium]|nr:MAG: hypothetical protein DMG58_16605 [Acidobacteriota bacterium]